MAFDRAMEKKAPGDRPDPAAHLKAVALRLFAQRGTDGVTVRQIADAAGQKNHAALTYHFGSKDALIRSLIVDGARAIDDRRNAWLDAAEADGGPHSVLEAMEGLVRTSVAAAPPPEGEYYNRFILGVQISNRALFMDALEGKWNSGYQRCLAHIRRLLPDMAPEEVSQRLVFMGAALGGIIVARESELADRSRPHAMWNRAQTLSHIASGLAAMLEHG